MAIRYTDEQLIVGVPNRHYEDWVQKTFSNEIQIAAAEVFGKPLEICFVIDPVLFQAARKEQLEASRKPAGKSVLPSQDEVPPQDEEATRPRKVTVAKNKQLTRTRSRRWKQIKDFIVGPCNRVAFAAAQSVIEDAGRSVNPLVIHGPVGTGKTHLLEAIYVGLRKNHPDWRITYITSEDFTNSFVQAMRFGKLASFRRQFRQCDALLIDDLNFLASKKATKEEFLHTFESLIADDRQMVFTCDCHPRLADDFGPELTDRLLGGAIWSLQPPDYETRLSILRHRSSQEKETPFPEDVLVFIATQLKGNVRELIGALNSIRHLSRVSNRPIDIRLVREAISDLLRHCVRVVTLKDIDQQVCQVLRITQGSLQKSGRNWSISHPRMVAMFLARKHTSSSYSTIGDYFGQRNHSTAVVAEKKVREWLEKGNDILLGEQRFSVRDLIERVERELLR